MSSYSDLVIHYDSCMKGHIAGYHSKWHRPMMIDDVKISKTSKTMEGNQAAMIIPASILEHELQRLSILAIKENITVTNHINAALGVATFYKKQKAFKATDCHLIVVDVNEGFTEVCYLQHYKERITLKDIQRIDFGIEMIADSVLSNFVHKDMFNQDQIKRDSWQMKSFKKLYSEIIDDDVLRRNTVKEVFSYKDKQGENNTLVIKRQDIIQSVRKYLNPILHAIDNMIFRHHIPEANILLSGKVWLCQESVQMVMNRMAKHNVFSYRPEVAAILGGVAYLHDNVYRHSTYAIVDEYKRSHYKGFWGEVNKLNPIQQEDYWKVLESVREGKDEVSIRGTKDDLYSIYLALHVDFPEVCILWHYEESKYMSFKDRDISYTKIFIKYYPNGTERLLLINNKADQILSDIMKDGDEYSDEEIIRKLYLYMSEHYHYTKEKTEMNDYPEYAYTLEALLRHGVCQGYATSMIYLLKKLQIPIHYISGDADGNDFGGHAWNIIQTIDGKFRHLDITWDLEKVLNNRNLKHFLLDDIEMRARKHFWEVQEYPACI